MNYKSEVDKFQSLDIFNKKNYLVKFFDDMRFELDNIFLSPLFKYEKDDSQIVHKYHNRLSEKINLYEKECINTVNILNGGEILWFKKYHIWSCNLVIRKYSSKKYNFRYMETLLARRKGFKLYVDYGVLSHKQTVHIYKAAKIIESDDDISNLIESDDDISNLSNAINNTNNL
jgi:hypothetical protein